MGEDSPIRTKTATNGVVFLCASLVSQLIASNGKKVDVRDVSYLTYWGLLLAPLSHYYQNLMFRRGPKNLLAKILLDHAFFRCPLILAFSVYLRLMKGEALDFAWKNSRKACIQLWRDSTRVFPVTQLLNFTIIPLQYRVLYGNAVLFFWAIYMGVRLKLAEVQKDAPAPEEPAEENETGGLPIDVGEKHVSRFGAGEDIGGNAERRASS